MPSDVPSAAPALDRGLLALLREDLEDADYTSDRAREILGDVAADALAREQALPARQVLAGRTDAPSVLLDVFTLGSVRSRAQLAAALPRLGVEGALTLRLIEPSDDEHVRAMVDLAPYHATDDTGEITWWIASDLSELATGRALGSDHVLGVGGASLTLVRITPREQVDRALDMGCGCGIQALHASRHARTVVATDLSERALAFAAFNAALNGIDLDLRHGSLFEPVATADGTPETFDLIVSNPPFVITPRDGSVPSWTYRDGGAAGDALVGQVVEQLPAHLAPGGIGVMLGNWEITAGAPWDAHPRAWLERGDLDALVIQRETEDPAQYAEAWARDGGITPREDAWEPMIGAWLQDFARRDVRAIGFGYVMLARPAAEVASYPPVRVLEEVVTSGSGLIGARLAASLRASRDLATRTDADLLASRPVRAADVSERRHLVPGAWDPLLIELVQGGGLGRTVRADSALAAVVGACDGELTLAQILGAVTALLGDEGVGEAVLPSIREMVRTGMLSLGPPPPGPGVDTAAIQPPERPIASVPAEGEP